MFYIKIQHLNYVILTFSIVYPIVSVMLKYLDYKEMEQKFVVPYI